MKIKLNTNEKMNELLFTLSSHYFGPIGGRVTTSPRAAGLLMGAGQKVGWLSTIQEL